MKATRHWSHLATLLLIPAATACGADTESSVPEESATSTTSAVVNGSSVSAAVAQSRGLVAIYHRDKTIVPNPWFPRVCSGKIIRSVNGQSKVITARHCVTGNGSTGGTLLTPSELRLLPGANPGLPNPDPPAAAVTPVGVTGAPVDSTTEVARDLAVITVNANWSAQAASKDPLYLGDPALLINANVQAFGYGLNVADWSCQGNGNITTGAGTARSASFKVTSSQRFGDASLYRHTNQNSLNQAVICGDSGGPDFTTVFGFTGMAHFTGVHSTGGTTFAEQAAPSVWLQNAVGGSYLTAFSGGLDAGYVFGSNAVSMLPPGDVQTTPFTYSLQTKLIKLTSTALCMSFGVRNDPPQSIGAIVESCGTSGSNQVWTITNDLRLRNQGADGMCLTVGSDNRLYLNACLDAGSPNIWLQRFHFHPQP